MQKQSLVKSSVFSLVFIFVIWSIKIFEAIFDLHLYHLGIKPQTLSGLQGLFFSPLLHSDFEHLFSNTFPILILLTSIFYFYKKIAVKLFLYSYIVVGVLVWLFARESYHIGASGILYAFFGFLVFSGIVRKQKALLAISLLTIFFYGSLIWGIFPQKPHVSWESHLFGFLTGMALAFYFKNEEPYLYIKERIVEDPVYENDFWNDVIEE